VSIDISESPSDLSLTMAGRRAIGAGTDVLRTDHACARMLDYQPQD
jgi:hypothetical protein